MKLPWTAIFLLSLYWSQALIAQPREVADSLKTKPVNWNINTRINSQGFFTLGGRMRSPNPTLDVSIDYARRTWGIFYFKGTDLVDHATFYNFSLITVYRPINLCKAVRITPSVGTFLRQVYSAADRKSDMVAMLTTTIKIGRRTTFEQLSLFTNLVLNKPDQDWVNRFRFSYNSKHLDLVTTLYHNNMVFDKTAYWSGSLNVAYSRVRISAHFSLNAGITAVVVLKSTDEQTIPKDNAVLVSVGVLFK